MVYVGVCSCVAQFEPISVWVLDASWTAECAGQVCLRSLASVSFVRAFLKAATVIVWIEAQCLFTLCAGPGCEVRVFDGRTEGKIVEARGPEARSVGAFEG